ncbi:uncharacterized protein VTP21DRAFT_9799 [Calcarisporiella thermophila]|uniref:uncharacterized protein n=1 Tax=Calcarisporiella thermophila TaxID=911321 RepID=UPI003744902E
MSDIDTPPIEPLHDALSKIENYLNPLLAEPLTETIGKLSLQERAQLQILIAHSINTLMSIYLKTQGAELASHPVKQEIARVKSYLEKLQNSLSAKERTMAIDQEAAKRFIMHALAGQKAMEQEEEEGAVGEDDS